MAIRCSAPPQAVKLGRGQKRGLRRNVRLQSHAARKSDGPRVAVVGVTGAVGREFLRVSFALLNCNQPVAINLFQLVFNSSRLATSVITIVATASPLIQKHCMRADSKSAFTHAGDGGTRLPI